MYNLKTSERVLYGDTYLVISLNGKNLIPYQEDMLYENHLPGYLGFYTKFDNETLVIYNITNCVSLSDFIGGRMLTRRQYLMIVDAVIGAMILRDQYFLSENSLLIHQDYIYIKDNSEIVLVYLPSEVDIDSKLALKEFVAWLTAKLDVSEPGASEAAIPLQLMIGNQSFNLKVMKETVIQILSSAPQETARRAGGPTQAPRVSNQPGTDIPVRNKAPLKEKSGDKTNSAVKKRDANLFGIGVRKKKADVKPDKAGNRNPGNKPPHDRYTEKTPAASVQNEGYQIEEPPKYAQPELQIYNVTTDILKEYGRGASKNLQLIIYLLFKPNTADEQIIQIDKTPFIIGRGDNSDYKINDISISREHAKIFLEKKTVYVVDTRSKFGTFVNDIRLHPDMPVELKDDDNIMFSGLAYSVKIVRMDDIYAHPQ